jgi:hypothetical protein
MTASPERSTPVARARPPQPGSSTAVRPRQRRLRRRTRWARAPTVDPADQLSKTAATKGTRAGERTRESVHDWSVPWVEGSAGAGPPSDTMVGTGLQYLHGLDMTALPDSANLSSHGQPGCYVLSDDEVVTRLEHWLQICRGYDDDPDGFRQQARERARRAFDTGH